ncbi:Mobile element protein [Pseudomonas chlororaphis]|uniref:Mobile element protein n=1 Tax=Pseudomonas chlororaphis TaxID=587753 RepID=A0A3G7TMX8_9PSED|nr:IS5 family transposase [Pseudomonas chlororaphis]AZE48231.1 Mobile element protein [Pseudomonas chlororaphis]
MPRLLLSDELWSKLEKILLQASIYNKLDLRMTVEGMLYRMRVGCPWRDLPEAFGCFVITGGEVNDCTAAPELIAKLPDAQAIVADKGYDSERIRGQIEAKGSKAVIPRRRNSVKGNADLDRGLYRYRHLVENAFARLKHYRAVASRYDKLKRNYESVVAMACGVLWLPM